MTNDTTAQPTSATEAGEPPPAVVMLQMLTGYWISQALYVAAKLGIADLVAAGTTSAQVLAEQTGVDETSLHGCCAPSPASACSPRPAPARTR